jgi:hypothetical protein
MRNSDFKKESVAIFFGQASETEIPQRWIEIRRAGRSFSGFHPVIPLLIYHACNNGFNSIIF